MYPLRFLHVSHSVDIDVEVAVEVELVTGVTVEDDESGWITGLSGWMTGLSGLPTSRLTASLD